MEVLLRADVMFYVPRRPTTPDACLDLPATAEKWGKWSMLLVSVALA